MGLPTGGCSGGAVVGPKGPKAAPKHAAQKYAKRPDSIDEALARKLLPVYKGVVLQPCPSKNSYQQYYSEKEDYPRSKCFTYTNNAGTAASKGGFTREQCLLGAVKWAWAAHTKHTKVACPYHWLASEITP